jgi:serine/threonine-protein kinase
VYRGRHTRLDRIVAIKILPAGLAAEADFRNRFEREARAVAALKHPNIVQIFDFGDIDGMYYMVMEYIAGQDLAHTVRQGGALPLAMAAAVVRGIAGALDYAHAQGLVHRDIKPSNVMIENLSPTTPAASDLAGLMEPPALAMRPVLTDFGIAKMLAGAGGATKTGMVGTLDYMAPEQIRAAGEVDHRADIYALGIMLYEMLTGHLPFAADNPGAVLVAHLQKPAPDPRELVPALPEQAARAVLRALAKDPTERFPRAGALAQALIDE